MYMCTHKKNAHTKHTSYTPLDEQRLNATTKDSRITQTNYGPHLSMGEQLVAIYSCN